MNARTALVTGGTGFIGGNIVRALLRNGRYDKIFMLVRKHAQSDLGGRKRVTNIFSDVVPEVRGKITVMDGDITEENCGINSNSLDLLRAHSDRAECFHMAADIRFSPDERQTIFKTNLEGTRNLLNLIRKAGIRRLHHLSTAYICGGYQGTASENRSSGYGQTFRNPYEESKFLAEKLVWENTARDGLETTAYRPSIVVGDSKTGRTTSFAGYYAYMRGFMLLRQEVIRMLRRHPQEYAQEGIYLDNGTLHLPLIVWGTPQATINLVCIDYAVDLILKLSSNRASIGHSFHIVNPKPPRADWLLESGLAALDMRGVKLLDENTMLSSRDGLKKLIAKTPLIDDLEKKIHQAVRQYIDYSEGEPIFDTTNTKRVLGEIPVHPEVNEELVKKLLSYAVKTRFGKPR